MIRRPLTSRLLPLVALLVLFADEWLGRMGLAGKDTLDRYRARLASAPAGGTR